MTLADLRKQKGVETVEAEEEAHGGDRAHPGPLEYAQIGIVLAVITAVEVALYYVDMALTPLVTLLLVLSAAKFLFVVLWFMHLKFDNRLFSTMFAGGFVLALALFVVVLSTIGGELV